jgi:hypothetical protein
MATLCNLNLLVIAHIDVYDPHAKGKPKTPFGIVYLTDQVEIRSCISAGRNLQPVDIIQPKTQRKEQVQVGTEDVAIQI